MGHINLFEEAEQEHKRHSAEHNKQIGYTQRNNELACKSKKALFSEFDEITNNLPWYARTSTAAQTLPPGQQPLSCQTRAIQGQARIVQARSSRSRSPSRRRLDVEAGASVA